jgi:hypothetical protein
LYFSDFPLISFLSIRLFRSCFTKTINPRQPHIMQQYDPLLQLVLGIANAIDS